MLYSIFIGDMMRFLVSSLACFFLSGIGGCAVGLAAPLAVTSGEQPLIISQLILKFKPDTLACDAAGVARLAFDTGVSVELLRPMSGHACVIRQISRSQADVLTGQAILQGHPAIEWIEQDRVMKTL